MILAGSFLYLSGRFWLYVNSYPANSPSSTRSGSLVLESSAFDNGGLIPALYTCDEKQVSPPLSISGVPDGTESFVLIMEDRDVPKSLQPDGTYLHWAVFNIPANTRSIAVGEVVGVRANSGNGVAGYVGPCPGTTLEPREHRYFFDLYAIDTVIQAPEGADPVRMQASMKGHILNKATLMGRYERREK